LFKFANKFNKSHSHQKNNTYTKTESNFFNTSEPKLIIQTSNESDRNNYSDKDLLIKLEEEVKLKETNKNKMKDMFVKAIVKKIKNEDIANRVYQELHEKLQDVRFRDSLQLDNGVSLQDL